MSPTLFKKKSLGKPKDNKGDKNKDTTEKFSIWHLQLATADNKDHLTPSQINIKHHTKGSFTSVPFTQFIMSGFQ